MSSVEEVSDPPPDKTDIDKEKEENTSDSELTASKTETESNSLTGSWTLLEKDDDNPLKKPDSDAGSVSGSSIEVLDKNNYQDKQEETDSDSIETISDDEILVAQSHLASYCNLSDNNQGATDSLTSTTSTLSVASDGIPIKSQNEDNPEEQYEWNSEGEREIPEDRIEEIAPQEINDSEPEDDINPVLEPGEPGYDLDDDGLPGEPLPPLPQEVELYPSQELDPNYQAIRKEKIYKHDKNLQVDHFLTAILVLALALAIGLGIGHFLGLSERLEVQEMYENLQEERLDLLQGDLVSCIEGEEGLGGDDQDLDDRVIKQLWEENQDLRDQVHQYKTDNPQNDEAMAAILRDKINDLLTANADLEREVVKLRYADAARGAAESVETLNKLRKTRDTLNDIVNENDQLKIEVGKARYGEPLTESSCSDEKENLEMQVIELKREIRLLRKSCSKSSSLFDTIETAFNVFHESTIDPIISKIQKEDFSSSWTSKRNEELKQKQEDMKVSKRSDNSKHDDDEHDDEIKNESADNLSKYLTELLRIKKQLLNRDGTINWSHANQFMESLDEDLGSKFGEVGLIAKQEMEHLLEKFKDLKSMIDTQKFKSNVDAAKTASLKFLQSIIGAVEDVQEASDDAAEESDWVNGFKAEILETKKKLDKKWIKIQHKWDQIISKTEDEDNDDDDDEDDDDDDDHIKKHSKQKRMKHDPKQKWKKDEEEEEDDDDDDDKKKQQTKYEKRSKWKKDDDDDDEDDEGYHSNDEYKNRKKHHKTHYSNMNHKNNSTKTDWEQKRSLEREKMRKERERSDWIFERAKHRKDIRYEETRGDWYFDRKHQRNIESDNTKSKQKGEKLQKDVNKKSKLRGETENKFKEKVQIRERHFKEQFKNNNGRY